MPKHRVSILFFLMCLSCALVASAQLNVQLPRPSQHAVVAQRIGLTDITIDYHRPLVNNRKVWGGTVPYGQVWRAGANENTTISFSDPVMVEGKPLDKGAYGVHMIPTEDTWTVIFSKASKSWGSFTYDQAEDALRVTVKPHAAEMHEALTYDFVDPKADSVTAVLQWEKLAVPFNITLDTKELTYQNLKVQFRGFGQYTWDAWDGGATYLLDSKIHPDEALKWSDQSIQVEERFENLMTKARTLDELNRKDEAKAIRKKALDQGNALQLYLYARQLMGQKKQAEAFDVFRLTSKKYPTHWAAIYGLARIDSAEGKYPEAIKKMNQSMAALPAALGPQKTYMQGLVKKLEANQDINK